MRNPLLMCVVVVGATVAAASPAAIRQAASKPATRPATEPATRPASQPASQPATPAVGPGRFRYQPGKEAREIAEEVGLTEQQWQKVGARIAQLAKEQAKWLAGEEKQLQALAQQVTQARQAKDRSRIRQLETRLRPLLKERNSIFVNELDVVMSVLTDKQKVAYEAWRLLRTVMRTYEQAGMTDAQEAAAKEMCLAYAARRLAASTWREKTGIRKELLKAVRQDVLTEQQRIAQEAFELNRSAMWFYRLDFTDQQKTAIYKLCRTIAAERIKTEDWREQARLRRQMLNTVYREILTDQQRSKARDPGRVQPSTRPVVDGAQTRPATLHQVTTESYSGCGMGPRESALLYTDTRAHWLNRLANADSQG